METNKWRISVGDVALVVIAIFIILAYFNGWDNNI
jgi:hypothetical protein